MLLTELAVQNVAGFPPKARVPLKAGLNALVGREAEVALVLKAVLYPGAEDGLALAGAAAPRKAALTIVGKDGHSWRVVRDFDQGRTLLHSDPTTRQAVKVSEDEGQIARALVTEVGLPPPEVFRELCWLPQAVLPSELDKRVVRAGSDKLPATSQGAELQVTPEDARRKLPEIKRELERAVEFEKAQDAVFQLQTRVSELAGDAGPLDELLAQQAGLEEKAAAYRRLGELTAGLALKIRRYPEAQARREGALAELKRKQEEYERQLTAAPDVTALLRDQVFLGGLAGGALCVALALLLGWNELWWLDPVGFGVAAIAAWRWVGEVEGAESGRRRLTDLVELEKRVQKQYEAETNPVHEAMRQLGANSPADVLGRLEERDVLEARKVALLREIEEVQQDPAIARVAAEREGLLEKLRERELYVNSFGFSRDPGAIRREIALYEEALGLGAAAVDPLAAPIERGAQVTGLLPPALLESFKERLAQYLVALTDRRFVALKAISPGVYHVVAASGASGPVSGLPPSDRDLILVALRLALFERLGVPLKLPLIVDEPSRLVDAPHRALFVKMLKALGGSTQVLVRAFEAPPAGVVDHVAQAVAPSGKAA